MMLLKNSACEKFIGPKFNFQIGKNDKNRIYRQHYKDQARDEYESMNAG